MIMILSGHFSILSPLLDKPCPALEFRLHKRGPEVRELIQISVTMMNYPEHRYSGKIIVITVDKARDLFLIIFRTATCPSSSTRLLRDAVKMLSNGQSPLISCVCCFCQPRSLLCILGQNFGLLIARSIFYYYSCVKPD